MTELVLSAVDWYHMTEPVLSASRLVVYWCHMTEPVLSAVDW